MCCLRSCLIRVVPLEKYEGIGLLIFKCSQCGRTLGTYRGEYFFLWDPRMVVLPCEEEESLGDVKHIMDTIRVVCAKCHKAKLKLLEDQHGGC